MVVNIRKPIWMIFRHLTVRSSVWSSRSSPNELFPTTNSSAWWINTWRNTRRSRLMKVTHSIAIWTRWKVNVVVRHYWLGWRLIGEGKGSYRFILARNNVWVDWNIGIGWLQKTLTFPFAWISLGSILRINDSYTLCNALFLLIKALRLVSLSDCMLMWNLISIINRFFEKCLNCLSTHMRFLSELCILFNNYTLAQRLNIAVSIVWRYCSIATMIIALIKALSSVAH